jgi:molecular chaperone GrpE
MSDRQENSDRRPEDESPPAAEASAPARSQSPRSAPFKVIDRRFWARGEAGEEPGGEGAEGPPSTVPSVIEELQKQVADLRAREHDLLAAFRQARDDNDAFRQRLQRDVERRVGLGKASLLRDLLEVADNLERAVAAAGTGAGAEELVRGVRQVLGQVQRLMVSQGVEEVAVAGQPFSPETAEAVEMREVREAGLDGKVVEVAQRGYRYGGQVLRPARVAVGRCTPPPALERPEQATSTGCPESAPAPDEPVQ